MKYQEKIKEKKYKPLFGYGYEPRTVQKKERGNKSKQERYDLFGNMIYELPVEAEADTDTDTQSGLSVKQNLLQTGEEGQALSAEGTLEEDKNGFEKPQGNPLMGVVIALTVAIALFLIAVIMSLKDEPKTVRRIVPSEGIVCCVFCNGIQTG